MFNPLRVKIEIQKLTVIGATAKVNRSQSSAGAGAIYTYIYKILAIATSQLKYLRQKDTKQKKKQMRMLQSTFSLQNSKRSEQQIR